MYRVESRRNQAPAAICPLPVEMKGECLILPTMMCDMCEMLPTREAHLSPRVQSFYWSQSHRHAALITQHPPSSQTDMACPRAPGVQK